MTGADANLDMRVLFVAPTRRDGEVTCSVLDKSRISCERCATLSDSVAQIARGAGALLLTDTVATPDEVEQLLAALKNQPTWSDFPVILLMQYAARRLPAVARLLTEATNIVSLERPPPTQTVVSSIHAALRGRQRQYQIRDQIEAIRAGEAQMRQTQERFEAMANSIPQLAWMANPDGWIFWYNQRWHDYCGTTPEQMEGWQWQSSHDAKELPRVMETWKQALAAGEFWEDTFPLRRHDGVFRWHLSRAQPFRDSAGKIRLWFGTNTDVTDERNRADERQHLLESEQAARREAERANRMKDEFLATLSHELRTPLNAIFGWTQLLKLGHMDKAMVDEAVTVIDRNIRAQTQLIDDLLDMSRVISGKIRLEVTTVQLSAVVDAALDAVKPAIDAKSIRIEKIVDPMVGPVSGDFNRLQQVLWNLLTNAVKFTPKEGRVQIVLERVNSHAEITVSDSGKGIESEFLPYLFQRFSQEDGSTTRQYGGLGLGLSIVKSLVELHGGSIRAESGGKDRGATFVVRLPLRVAKFYDPAVNPVAKPTVSAAEHEPLKVQGIKVLVVDDEPDARELVRRFLIENRAIAEVAGSSAEARRLMETFHPDVIVSDIGMPVQDGYEFMRSARKSGVRTPAIALTAFARSEDRIRAIQAGYQAHLPKPVEPAELLAMIANLFESFHPV